MIVQNNIETGLNFEYLKCEGDKAPLCVQTWLVLRFDVCIDFRAEDMFLFRSKVRELVKLVLRELRI